MRMDIERLLRENPAVDDYRINRTETESYELFFGSSIPLLVWKSI